MRRSRKLLSYQRISAENCLFMKEAKGFSCAWGVTKLRKHPAKCIENCLVRA